MFKIGEFARLSGTTRVQLRHYDDIGLFRPAWTDPASRYRFYSAAQLPQLHRILALRDIGFALSDVASLVAAGTDLSLVLAEHRRLLIDQRREIDRQLAALDIRFESNAGATDVVVRRLAAERVASIRSMVGPRDGVEPVFEELESYVRDRGGRASRPPGSLLHQERADGSRDLEVYVPIAKNIEPQGRISIRRLPPCRAATLIDRGGYETLAKVRRSLLSWVERTGLRPAGPLRIVYLQFGASPELEIPGGFVTDDVADFVTELQQPIDQGPLTSPR